MQRIIRLMVVLAIVAMGATAAQAQSSYLSSFRSTYPAAASTLGQCVLCHIDPAGGGPTNPYGSDYAANGHNFKTIEPLDSDGDGYTNIVEIQALTWPGDPASHPAVGPPACSSYTYTLGACQSNNTAPVTSYIGVPAGCSGGATPATTQPCTYVPPPPGTCTYTYSAWGACQSNNTQTRTVSSSTPAGCTGTPVISQACTYAPPAPGSGSMHVSIGVFRNGAWYIDADRNGAWEQSADTVTSFGIAGDIPIMGDWDGSGTKKIGVFRNGIWYLDMQGNGVWNPSVDVAIPFGTTGDIPVVGDWNGNGKTKIGIFRNGNWYLDYPGTGIWVGCGAPADPSKDACISFGAVGDLPVVGDWNGNGKIKIGVFRNGTWYLDYPGTGTWIGCGAPGDPSKDNCIGFGAAGDVPVVADWNGSGTIKIGVFRNGQWYVDMLGNGTWTPGADAVLPFGMAGDSPIVK